MFWFLRLGRPTGSTRTDTRFPYTTLVRSVVAGNVENRRVTRFLQHQRVRRISDGPALEQDADTPAERADLDGMVGSRLLHGRDSFAGGASLAHSGLSDHRDRKSTRLHSSH